jgi:hypothetical protein
MKDVFLIKLDAMGNFLWRRSFGDAMGDQAATGVAVDQVGHAVLVGKFTGSLDFGNGSLTVAPAIQLNIFVAKFDGVGNTLWSKGCGGDSIFGGDAAIDPSGNVALTGSFKGTTGFGGPTPLQTMGQRDIYVAKLAP